MDADRNDAVSKILAHLRASTSNLEADNLDEAARFIGEDIGLPALVVLPILKDLTANGQIEWTENGFNIHATPQRRVNRPARNTTRRLVSAGTHNGTGQRGTGPVHRNERR
jgi:hypothetical protein